MLNKKKYTIILLVYFLLPCINKAQKTDHLLTQNSTLTIKNLKKKIPKSFTKETLITYKLEENFHKGTTDTPPTLSTSLTSIYLLERLQKIKALEKFTISFSLGALTSGYGSMFKAVFKNSQNQKEIEEGVKELAYVLGGWVGYSGISLFLKRKLYYSNGKQGKEVIYWDGLSTEYFCIHHLEKIRKILRPDKLSAVEYFFSNLIFDQRYSRFEVDFRFLPEKGGSKFENKVRNFKAEYKLESLYQTRKLNKIFGNYFYTNLEKSVVEIVNEGEQKSFLSSFSFSKKDSNKKTYREIHSKGLKSLKGVQKRKEILEVHRKELGKTVTPGRKIVYWLKNNSKRDLETVLTLPFSSIHNPWINTLQVKEAKTEKKIKFDFRFKEFKGSKLGYIKAPLLFDVKFKVPGETKVVVTMEYFQNFIDMNELDPEDERGTYLPPSLVFYRLLGEGKEEEFDFRNQDGKCDFDGDFCIGEMETMLTKVVTFDNTAAFTTLTTGVVFSAFLYSTFAAWGVSESFK